MDNPEKLSKIVIELNSKARERRINEDYVNFSLGSSDYRLPFKKVAETLGAYSIGDLAGKLELLRAYKSKEFDEDTEKPRMTEIPEKPKKLDYIA